jgi:hypothetical protein
MSIKNKKGVEFRTEPKTKFKPTAPDSEKPTLISIQ